MSVLAGAPAPAAGGACRNPVLDEIYATGRVRDAGGNALDAFGPSVPYATGKLLYDLVHAYACEQTLEIGMAYGLSTLFFCQAHRDRGAGMHTAMDPFQDHWKSVGLLNVTRAGLAEHFRFIAARSFEALPEISARRERFDLVFIDGAHRFDAVMVDFFYVDQVLKVGGLVVFDDLRMPAVRKVVSYVMRNRAYEPAPAAPVERKPLWKRIGVAAQRILDDPAGWRHLGFRFGASNVAVLRKLAWDNRPWDFHRTF